MKITKQQLEDFARGAALLGAGGGGDPYIGRLLAEQAFDDFDVPEVIDPDSLDDDATVIPIAMLGAPTVLIEKAASGDDLNLLLKEMEHQLGKKVDAVMPIEIGGVNSCLPFVIAARAGLPVVNADGMGRAFPNLDMVTFNVYGCAISPIVMTDEHLNALTIKTRCAKKAEAFARSIVAETGLSAMISCYPLTGKQVKEYGVKNTITLGLEIGQAIKFGRQSNNALGALLDYLASTEYYKNARVLGHGKVEDVLRETRDGFSFGHCTIVENKVEEGANIAPREPIILSFQNEFLAAKQGDKFLATVPDIIAIVDSDTIEPITAESVRFGQRVTILAISVPEIMTTDKALAIFGPRVFGLDTDYQSL